MASSGELEADPLFLGLTRPAMMFGVSYTFAGMNFITVLFLFITTTKLQSFLLLFFLHGVGYYFSQREPLFMELFMVRQQKCNKCRNRMYHGLTNSYDVL